MAHQALEEFIDEIRPETSSAKSRLERAGRHFGANRFSRKDYMKLYKSISSATASRDLKLGADGGMLKKEGKRALTVYIFRH